MAHEHSMYDGDTHFKINPITRQIENTTGKVILMQNDHNSERFTFEIPRLIDGHDMSLCNKVEVHYINIDAKDKSQEKGVYPIEDLQISPDSEDVVICSWLISQNATKFAGTLNFVLRYACLTGTTIDYQWYTDIHKGISVSESISNSEYIATEYADILEQWRQELFNGNGGNVDLSGYVKSVNGIAPDENGNVEIAVGGVSTSVEPMEDDIPKVFFGGALQQTKTEAVVPFRYISKTEDISGYAEIKAQGNSTMMWPKKNQTVKLYTDADCTEKLKINFKGWGKQNKFVIKANWRDLTHVRDIVSVRLEGDCMRTNPDYAELPELLRTSPNLGGIDGFPVVVYAAGVYQGRYMWNIPKDKWMANMDDDLEEHCILCSENYESGCFRAAANINGSDWTDEIHDTVPASIKTRWNEVISFVMNSTDEEFVANLDSYIKVSTLIDRHLMGLLSCDFDGYGKNQLYITYDGQLWYADRYDKDGTWGNCWSGSNMLPSNYGREQYEDFTSSDSDGSGNLLFIRLEQLFWERLQTRWAELRVGALSVPNIINRFRELYDITPPYLIEEDYASTTANGAFTTIPNKTTCTIQQIQKFVVERHAWMDECIAGLTPAIPIPCTGISLDKSTLAFTEEGTQTLTATVTPDGCTDTLTWESNNTSVATVSGGVVTAIANGNATITARCGDYSAICAVAVSGIYEPILCTGISFDKTELSFDGKETQTITATVTPYDTTDSVVWVSSNPFVASISVDGNVCTITSVSNGNAVITATCGSHSANCSVDVRGIVDTSLIYSLPERTVFNGTSDYIDTGIKLAKEDTDVTIMFAADNDVNTENQSTILHCIKESSPYPGYAFAKGYNRKFYQADAMGLIHRTEIDGTVTDSFKAVITHEARSGAITVKYLHNGMVKETTNADGNTWKFTSIENTLLIGCYQGVDGTKGRFWKGTMHNCRIYNRVLSDDEISAYLT